MDNSLLLLSENILHMLRGALMVLFIVFSINLCPKRNDSPILNFLFWLYVIMSVMLLMAFGLMVDQLKDSEFFNTIRTLILLSLVPLTGSFFLKIIIPDFINSKKVFLLLVPTIALAIIYTITQNLILLTISFVYTSFLALWLFILVITISIRYDRYLKNNYSNIDNRHVRWVRVVICAFEFWYVAWCLIVIYDNRWLDSIYYLAMMAIWIFIYRYSIKHETTFQSQELFSHSSKKEEEESTTSEYLNDKVESALVQYLNQERPWLNPSLTLQDLAIALNTNRTYLSGYFNKKLGTTFYDYLNNLRVNYACGLLLSDPNLSILQVGERSGFNSLSTFRRSFEKHKGCTPAKYRRLNAKVPLI